LSKADIQYSRLENLLTNVRFTPGSGPWAIIDLKVRL